MKIFNINIIIFKELDLTSEKRHKYVEYSTIRGMKALEALIDDGPFCVGQTMTMADMFFVPQMRNFVERFKVNNPIAKYNIY